MATKSRINSVIVNHADTSHARLKSPAAHLCSVGRHSEDVASLPLSLHGHKQLSSYTIHSFGPKNLSLSPKAPSFIPICGRDGVTALRCTMEFGLFFFFFFYSSSSCKRRSASCTRLTSMLKLQLGVGAASKEAPRQYRHTSGRTADQALYIQIIQETTSISLKSLTYSTWRSCHVSSDPGRNAQ